jgi:hypothetical protein
LQRLSPLSISEVRVKLAEPMTNIRPIEEVGDPTPRFQKRTTAKHHFLEVFCFDQCEIDFPFSLNGTAYLPFSLGHLIDPSSTLP